MAHSHLASSYEHIPGNASPVYPFAFDYGISIRADIDLYPTCIPNLHKFGENGDEILDVDMDGALFAFAQIDYLNYEADNRVEASRVVEIIPPGERTELAFWLKSAPDQALAVSSGLGWLITCGIDDHHVGERPLGEFGYTDVTLFSETFYTLKAAYDSHGPLVVSALYKAPVNLEELEVSFAPDASEIETQYHQKIIIPEPFKVATA